MTRFIRRVRRLLSKVSYLHVLVVVALAFSAGACNSDDRSALPSVLSDAISDEGGAQWDFRGWAIYRGDRGSHAYSALDQINRSNVDQLEVAWTYHTRDKREDPPSTIENNPIVVDGIMYVTSPQLKVIALDAATGQELWNFETEGAGPNRGVVYWEDGDDKRIFVSAGSNLYSLDATSGHLVTTFGNSGIVDLRKGLDRDASGLSVKATSPGIIYEDLLILGSSVSEGPDRAAPGHIRGYDVRTGRREWIFHTIPFPGEFGHDTWEGDAWKTAGGANAWAGLSLDEERGLVFAPTGSPSFDYYGGDREGKNLFANSVLALDAETGERVWHFQTVHHDLWDYDLPTPPNLVTVEHGGRRVDAVAQVTKQGYVFLLDRETGDPLFPVEERSVPASDLPGENAWPTQPAPVKPPPFARQGFTEDRITDISEEAHIEVRRRFEKARGGSLFTPPSREGTIFFPGFAGGAEWGGASFDPSTGVLYVRSGEVPWFLKMIRPDESVHSVGAGVYQTNCVTCHGVDRQGQPPNMPSLIDIDQRRSKAEVSEVIAQGQGRMPAFPSLSEEEMDALIAFLFGEEVPSDAEIASDDESPRYPFISAGRSEFRDENGYPAVKPPWSTLNAINLNTGEIDWKIPLGEHPELTKRGIPITGTESIGGPIVTAGGLVFIGATMDEKFHAFDKRTGELLWETTLPAGGYATPSTYDVAGKQYVVIAAGGGGQPGTKAGDAFVAFSLP